MTSTCDLVLEDPTPQKQFKTMRFSERINYIRTFITVEPIIACYLIAAQLCEPALTNMKTEKGCRHDAGFNDTICDALLTEDHDLSNHSHIVQSHILTVQSWCTVVQNIVPLIILLVFAGSYSDKYKIRRPFFLIPIVGELFSIAGCTLCAFYMREWSLTSLGVFQFIVPSFFGGEAVVMMAMLSYIGDVSSLEMRTLRIGIVHIVANACTPIAQSFSGILFRQIGYYGTFGIGFIIMLTGFLYGYLVLKESRQEDEKIERNSLCSDLVDKQVLIGTFKILFERKVGTNRKNLVILMLVTFISLGLLSAESQLAYWYFNTVLKWDVVTFSYFATFNTVVHLIGTVIGLPLFSNLLKLNDYWILIITFIDKIFTNVVLAFANTNFLAYLGAFISIFYAISNIAFRSLATKVVSAEDLGKAQSLFAVCEALGRAILAPTYNILIYEPTIDTFPGAIFIVSVALLIICIILVMWVMKSVKVTSNEEKVAESEKQKPNTYDDVYGAEAVTHI